MKMKIFRHLVQVLAIVIMLLPMYYADMFWYGTYISANLLGVQLTDPLTALEITVASKTVWLPLIVSMLPLAVIAIIFGRLFCSFICPLNFLLELIPLKKKAKLKSIAMPVAALGIVIVLSTILSIPVFNTVSPVFALMRMLLFGAGVELVLVALVVIAAFIWGQKIWCRTLCPLGAIYGLLGMKRRLVIKLDDDKCINCGKCIKACSMGVVPGKGEKANAFVCTNCGDCITACQEDALSYSFKGMCKPK